MRQRNMLHKSKLGEFKAWLETRGYKSETVKGDYEVLRMRFNKSNILLVYDRLDAKEHYTTHGLANDMVKIWLRGKH